MGFLNKDGNIWTAARQDADGSAVTDVYMKGTKLVQQFTEVDESAGKLTFTKNIGAIGIYNRDDVDGVFKVNGFDIHVPAGESAEFAVGGTPSNIVEVTGSTQYIISRYE
jgi:hypothetical protein